MEAKPSLHPEKLLAQPEETFEKTPFTPPLTAFTSPTCRDTMGLYPGIWSLWNSWSTLAFQGSRPQAPSPRTPPV